MPQHSINLISETILVLIFKYYTIENDFYYLYMLLTCCYFCNLGNVNSEVRKMEQQIQQVAINMEINSNLYCLVHDFR